MFAYCNNNPTNFTDASGQYPDDYFGWMGQEIGKWLYEIISTDRNEMDDNGNLTLNAKLKRTGESIIYNTELSAGIGLGLYVEHAICDLAGISLGIYGTCISACYSDGRWQWGQELQTGAALTLFWYEFGLGASGFKPLEGDLEMEEWFFVNDTIETITIFSAATRITTRLALPKYALRSSSLSAT